MLGTQSLRKAYLGLNFSSTEQISSYVIESISSKSEIDDLHYGYNIPDIIDNEISVCDSSVNYISSEIGDIQLSVVANKPLPNKITEFILLYHTSESGGLEKPSIKISINEGEIIECYSLSEEELEYDGFYEHSVTVVPHNGDVSGYDVITSIKKIYKYHE